MAESSNPKGNMTEEIPLVNFARWDSNELFDEQSNLIAGKHEKTIRIQIPFEIPKGCYGVKIVDRSMLPILIPGRIALFATKTIDRPALSNIWMVGIRDQKPLIRTILKQSEADKTQPTKRYRKSFMTPTPLHIPQSTVSPIPPSSHEMTFLQKLGGDKELSLIPESDIVWKHPLLYVLKSNKPDETGNPK